MVRPNPCRHGAAVSITLATREPVYSRVLEPSGRMVRDLATGDILGAGVHELRWDGRDSRGVAVRGGLYLVRTQAGHEVFVSKVAVVP